MKGFMIYLFSTHPKYDPSDKEACTTMLDQWLERLIIIFGFTTIVGDASSAKLLGFVESLRHECGKK